MSNFKGIEVAQIIRFFQRIDYSFKWIYVKIEDWKQILQLYIDGLLALFILNLWYGSDLNIHDFYKFKHDTVILEDDLAFATARI